jgi:hypothetical protein
VANDDDDDDIKAWKPDTCLDFSRSGLVNMVTRYDLQYLLVM